MGDLVLVIAGGVCIFLGLLGSVLPALPGPPLSYLGLLLLQFTSREPFSGRFLLLYALLTILAAVLDYIIPVVGAKGLQGSKYGIWGSAFGLIAGLMLFPPLGILIGPLIGAFLGELLGGKEIGTAARSALGSLLGILAGTALKVILSLVMAYHFVVNVF